MEADFPSCFGAAVEWHWFTIDHAILLSPALVRFTDCDFQSRIGNSPFFEALKHFGSHKSKLVWANVWVSDIRHYDGMNAAWDAWLDKPNAPARSKKRLNRRTNAWPN